MEMDPKAKTLAQWEEVLAPTEIEALHDHNYTQPEQILTPDEVLDIIVEWYGGISSGYHIRSIISRVYGIEL